MLVERKCAYCNGSGLRMIMTASFLGLLKKEVPTPCEYCHGNGVMHDLPTCRFCEGQGLIGNEREICRACNGTGKADSFSYIPLDQIRPGVVFHRRCDQCHTNEFEITSHIENQKVFRSWDAEEELRHVEFVDRVKVRCANCGLKYQINIDKDLHEELDPQSIIMLEQLGIDLSYMNRVS